MKVIFFSKYSEFYLDFEKLVKLRENVDSFQDNCAWTCSGNFCQLWQKHMCWAVNVLKKCPNISDPTKRHERQLNFFDINEKLAKKYCRADFSSVLDPLTGWFRNCVLKQEFKGIQVTRSSGINNFGYVEAMKVIFFSKCSRLYVDFENLIKLWEDIDGFEDNLSWTCWGSFCQLWQEYMWSAINVLKKCPNIADMTKRHDKQLNLFDINGTLVKRWCRSDFSSVLDPSTGWFPKRVLKQEFKGNQVTTFFAVNNFANIEAMKWSFFQRAQNFM